MKSKKANYGVICGMIFLCVLLVLFVLAIGNSEVIVKILKPTEIRVTTEQVRMIEPVIIEHRYNITNSVTNNITTREGITQQLIDSANAIYENDGT